MINLLIRGAASWLLLLVLLPVASHAQGPVLPDETSWYGVISRSSGRSLDITNASAEAGATAIQWEFTHADSQQWRFIPAATGSEFFRIVARHTGQCLTLTSPDENAALVQRPWTGSFYQQWKLVPSGPLGSFMLISRGNDKCVSLAAADKSNSTPVVGQRPQNRASQQWKLFKLHLNLDPSQPGFGVPEPLLSLNTPTGNEQQPVMAPDGNTLYFTRTRYSGNMEGITESGDIWVSTSATQGRTWAPATRLDELNTNQHNGVMSVVEDGKALIIRGQYERDGTFRDLGLSKVPRSVSLKKNRPQVVEVANYYSTSTSSSFFMSPDQQLLLLSLERSDSEGGNDLYVSRPTPSGLWTQPLNLGAVVNSPGFDFAPWLAADGKTLYFSSYGHAGYGSSDIFVSTRLDDSWTNWTEPRNLGLPINGPGFNAFLSLSADEKQAFYSSTASANTPTDLFRTATGASPAPPVVPTEPPVAVVPTATTPRTLLTARTIDAKSRNPLATEVKLNRLGNDILFNATARTDVATGSFVSSLPPGRYRIQVTARATSRPPIPSR
ncbi:hypothetical protein CDA63_14265 [Hymenobacter amundsenii]|uniref:Ricin B lectin domain-containing protein n=1 Tax=Hymenobacter amundsenii TaxID=2006685 RepID=A0A246FIT1_9BACT|nr:RICIN domain-containing protein [Hymenobacter amundsenii]OWP62447.1 hypothetical protein CDA63_14265 [Hymenobacter amundsenii]